MKKLLVAVALMVPVWAFATCTWTVDTGGQSGKAVCTTASETAIAGAASTSGTGWPASMCPKGMYFTVCTDSGQAVTAALTLSVYAWNPWAALWAKWPDRNLTSEAITAAQRCQTFDALWTVVAGGKIAVIPTAGTIDGGGLTIWWACN